LLPDSQGNRFSQLDQATIARTEASMFKIGKLFHFTHVVSDLAAVDKWYGDVFGVTRFYRGYEKMAGCDASLIAIGEIVMGR
jgi:hypothetical protein